MLVMSWPGTSRARDGGNIGAGFLHLLYLARREIRRWSPPAGEQKRWRAGRQNKEEAQASTEEHPGSVHHNHQVGEAPCFGEDLVAFNTISLTWNLR